MYVQEAVSHFIFTYYIKWVTTSWTNVYPAVLSIFWIYSPFKTAHDFLDILYAAVKHKIDYIPIVTNLFIQ